MLTCSRCHTISPDTTQICPSCQADLAEFSTTAVALRQFIANPRVNLVHVAAAEDACPACRAVQGTYPKDQAPRLPIEGCSNPQGCKCFYQPVLEEIYP